MIWGVTGLLNQVYQIFQTELILFLTLKNIDFPYYIKLLKIRLTKKDIKEGKCFLT